MAVRPLRKQRAFLRAVVRAAWADQLVVLRLLFCTSLEVAQVVIEDRQVALLADSSSRSCGRTNDEAKFITGVMLPVDGGQSARIG
ncbi:MAG: hypothetical protein ACRD2L_16290 [Terriglobia bacterium]